MKWIVNNLIPTIIGSILMKIFDEFWNNRKYLNLIIPLILSFNQKIRLSCAYLFRIRSGNKYLLIKGNHIDQYQPVGGVYKTFESFQEIAHKLEITPEKEEHFYEDNDLRVYMPGKSVMKFIHWFNTGAGREFNVTREFYEEMVVPGFLPIEALANVKIEYIKQVHSDLHYSVAFKCKEVLLHNIFEVTLSDVQIETLISKISNGEKRLIFVDQQAIEKEAVYINGLDAKIGAHSKSIL